jgi:hypothetical protein
MLSPWLTDLFAGRLPRLLSRTLATSRQSAGIIVSRFNPAQPIGKARFGRENPNKSKIIQTVMSAGSPPNGPEPRKPKRGRSPNRRRDHSRLVCLVGALEARATSGPPPAASPIKDAAACERVGQPPLFGDQVRKRTSGRACFDPPRLVVQPLDRDKLVLLPEPGLLHRALMTRIVSS